VDELINLAGVFRLYNCRVKPLIAALCLLGTACSKPPSRIEKPAESVNELRQQVEKVLKDMHTPALSVAIVDPDGPEWIAALGVADVASGRPATPETLFRIGSVSKAFTSLAVLQLVNQGRLSLDDPVRELAPEVWFENPWEATDPVRVVHLLEHTTGWDDMHLRGYAKQAPDTMGLREQLDYDRQSRVSRWLPGTRMAYCNSGPPVAAYIVEKITGERFEDYVRKNLFEPIGMKTATYFQPAPESTTTLYHDDGKTPFPYWHILLRPAGAINASANDMANYLLFYLHRGTMNDREIIPAALVDRMENPTSTWAAKEGLKAGYGLGNFWLSMDGFVYHGHDGGVNGGLTEIRYMPDEGVGYFFSINTANDDTVDEIGARIRAYITRKQQKPPIPAVAPLAANAQDYAGWYEPNSPRVELLRFFFRLAGLAHFGLRDGKLVGASLGGRDELLPVLGTQFRKTPKKQALEPIATVALITPNEEGRFIQDVTEGTMKRIPAWFAIGEVAVVTYVLLAMASILIYALFWVPGGLRKQWRRPPERAIRLWPLIAVLSLIGFVVVLQLASMRDAIALLGNLTGWSVALFLATVLFAMASVASAVALWRAPQADVRRGIRGYSIAVTPALLITSAYLAYWGIIGLRTWA
jgi:CubicO group peptidase (beta-lactamase class C family)